MANQQPSTPTSAGGGGGGSSSGGSGSNSTSAGSPQQFCLRWNNYQTNLTNVFDQLLQSESFVDVTLACDGHSVKAHKMVLSACSPYFQALFFDNPCQHPIVIMKDIKWPELKAAVEFMYKGEINVSQEQIGPLLRVAESLKIRGLADVNSEHELASRIGVGVGALLGRSSPHDESSLNLIQQQQMRKKRRLASADRSPSNCSPERSDQLGEDCSSAGGNTPSETPRSMGSPSIPSISVTPQINLQELPLTGLGNTIIASGNGHSGASGAGQREQSGLPAGAGIGSHVSGSHVGSAAGGANSQQQQQTGVQNHLGAAHAVVQQLSVQQQQHQHHHHAAAQAQGQQVGDDLEIKPGIAEMIREEERAKLLESSHAWLGASTSSIADSYQYQLQSMWQKCWNTNQSLVHNLRFRERGPLKSWRPETMAEAIFSVLKEGLSLSQAARKYDIPYPTFVLYANRVHNMLGPSADGGADLRPKGRGRPQRILLGVWPDEHIRGVIRAVVFRDGGPITTAPHIVKEEPTPMYPALANYGACNGPEAAVSPSAAAAAVAAVAQGLRHQMCSMVAAAHSQQQQQQQHDMLASNLSSSLSSNLQAAMQQASQHHHQQQQQQQQQHQQHQQHQQQHHHHNSNSGMSVSTPVSLTQHHVQQQPSAGAGSNHGNSPLNLGLASPGGSGGPPESPMESPLASPLGSMLEPAVTLTQQQMAPSSVEVGIGVSGMTYKSSRGGNFVSPRPENLFQEDISELVKSSHAALKDKQDKIAVKLEPLTDSRCE